MQKKIREEFKGLFGCKRFAMHGRGTEIIGVGGTVRALLKLVNAYFDQNPENRIVTAHQLKEMIQLASSGDKKLKNLILKICPERIHTLIPGMLIAKNVIRETGCETIIVSRYGVREGYLHRRFLSK